MFLLRTLGALDLQGPDGRELRPILAQPKRFALLIYLALANAQRYRRRDKVVALFWPDLDQEHARGALRQALRFLRRTLGEGVVLTRGEEDIGIDPAAVICDASAFEEACGAGLSDRAVELYQGDFLDGFFVSEAAPEFEQWVDEERDRLRHLATGALWALAAERRATHDPAGAVSLARRAVGLSPRDESEWAHLIRFLDEIGDRAGALAAYDEFARRLRQEFDAEPSPETQALLHSVRSRAARASAAPFDAPPAAATAIPGSAPGPAPPPASRPRWPSPPLIPLAAAGLVALAAYLVAFAAGHRPGLKPERVAVAVLPIEDLSGDTARAYMAEGMTDELITDLARIHAMEVINRRTMMAYRGSKKTAREIARELGADAVVVGAVQYLGDTVHLSAQLVLGDGEQAAWAQSYDGSRGDLLRLQREIARAVAERVRVALTPGERADLAAIAALDPEVLDAYVRGRHWWNKRNGPALLRSIVFFNQALDGNPTFAPAYSGMADAYVQLGYASLLPPKDAFPKARAAARKALSLDSTLAEPHATLGYVAMYYNWDWPAAEREFRLAIARNPSYATAHEWYGLFLAAMGRFDEAQAEERQAQQLDPLSPGVAGTAGWVLHYSGKQREAEQVLRTALRTDSVFPLGHLYLGRVLQFQGQLDSALAQFEATGPLRNWVPTIAGNGYVYAQQGRRAEALAVLHYLDSLSATQYVTSYAVALVHTALGQRDSAFSWLDRAVDERTHWLVWLNRDLRWKPLRGDPRFAAVVHRVGLPQ